MPQTLSMLESWGLPPEITGRLGRHAGRQRTMFHDGHLLIILHKIPEPDLVTREAVFFYRSPNGDWRASVGNGIKAIDVHLQTYTDALFALNKEIETTDTAQGYFYLYNKILPISRAASNQHEALQEAREALKYDLDMISYRDEAYDIRRTAELLTEEAQQAMEYKVAQRAEYQAVQAESQARAAHRLNMIAAIFFPVTAVASIFGVNLPTGFEGVTSPILFWILMIISIAAGFMMRTALDGSSVFKK